ncbi:MAG: segregation/condensation protein A, partial [Planctomycetota bacterium]
QELQIGVDKRDVRYYAARVLEKVRGKSEVSFRDLFDLDEGRYGLIGCFIAILELMKQGVMRGHQSEDHGSIVVVFRGDPTMSAEQILAGGERLDGEDGVDDATPPRVSVPDLEGDEPSADEFDVPPDVLDPGRN